MRVRAARRPEETEREREMRERNQAAAAVRVWPCGRPSRGERGRDKVLGDLGFGPFTVLWAFLFNEVHLSPVFFSFFQHICVYILSPRKWLGNA